MMLIPQCIDADLSMYVPPNSAYYRSYNSQDFFYNSNEMEFLHTGNPSSSGFKWFLSINGNHASKIAIAHAMQKNIFSAFAITANEEVPFLSFDPSLSERIKLLVHNMGVSKSALAEILSISRQGMYDWIEGKTSVARQANLEKIEWLEKFALEIPPQYKGRLNLWLSRNLSGSKSLLDLLKEAQSSQKEVIGLILARASTPSKPSIGSWKKDKNKDKLYEDYRPFSDG